MRELDVAFTIYDAKPGTKLYAFFNGEPVNHLISELEATWSYASANFSNSAKNTAVVTTDSNGNFEGVFHIPPDTYETGTKALSFQSTPEFFTGDFSNTEITHCSANFTSYGVVNTLQDTITESGEIVNNLIGALGDPLAQSFFTYGTNGGVFVTSIDIFFDTKDAALPVSLEIRELVNGYPGPNLVSTNSKVSLKPEQVNLQITGSAPNVATTFTFDYPVYLPDNSDFCFVLLSNSNKYNVYVAELGQKSKETGKVVSEQPYIGSIFKSENNKTWTADQTRDIKFRINRASFSSQSVLALKANSPKYLILGTSITATSGSTSLSFRSEVRHGLDSGDIVTVKCLPNCNFRGISSADINGDRAITDIVDDYTFKISASTGASSSGTLNSSGIINTIQIDTVGSGYSVGDKVYVSAPPGGSETHAATVTEIDTFGGITSLTKATIVYPPYYIDPPVVTVIKTSSGSVSFGSGAELFVVSEAILQIETNKNINTFLPKLAAFLPPSTDIKTTGYTINDDGTYNLSTSDVSINEMNKLKVASLLLSKSNEAVKTPGVNSTEFELALTTPHENLSPVISLKEAHNLEVLSYNINNQTEYEKVNNSSVTSGSGSINETSLTVTAGGTGYTGTPTLVIDAPYYSWGTQATGTVTLSGSSIASATIVNHGSGYIQPPSVSVAGTGVGAVIATPSLTDFNTELLSTGGTAASKYITKRMTLATVSIGATVYVTVYSGNMSAFDVYIRTSTQASETPHIARPFQMMFCEIDRNKSTYEYEYKDYKFELMNLEPFDVYDIKIVMRSTSRSMIPIIDNYRCIITAS